MRTNESPWADVKDFGVLAFKGTYHPAVIRLLELLESAGVVMVREGELEQLAPEVATKKGPAWLVDALEQSAQCNVKTQAHVDRIVEAGQEQVAKSLVPQST